MFGRLQERILHYCIYYLTWPTMESMCASATREYLKLVLGRAAIARLFWHMPRNVCNADVHGAFRAILHGRDEDTNTHTHAHTHTHTIDNTCSLGLPNISATAEASAGCPAGERKFDKAWSQTLVMFFGEFMCIFLFLYNPPVLVLLWGRSAR